MKPALLAIAAVLAAPGISQAHDFWIEPSTFRPEPGMELKVGLRIGEQFKGEPVRRDLKKIKSFTITGPAAKVPVPGVDDGDPAGLTKTGIPGIHVIAYRSNQSSIELNAKDFESYLQEEGLESIIAERVKRGESDKSAKEVYSRCAKAIIDSGWSRGSGHNRLIGLPLELVPDQNPYGSKPEKNMTFRLLLHGKPLPGVKVSARNRGDGKNPVSAITDPNGKVTLSLERPGVWLVTCVHMFPASAETEADWESLWASLTFELMTR